MADEEPALPEGFDQLPASEQLQMARDQARQMLKSLLDAQHRAEQRARAEGSIGQPGYITGRHAMDQAIASTRRMLEALEALLNDVQEHGLGPQ